MHGQPHIRFTFSHILSAGANRTHRCPTLLIRIVSQLFLPFFFSFISQIECCLITRQAPLNTVFTAAWTPGWLFVSMEELRQHLNNHGACTSVASFGAHDVSNKPRGKLHKHRYFTLSYTIQRHITLFSCTMMNSFATVNWCNIKLIRWLRPLHFNVSWVAVWRNSIIVATVSDRLNPDRTISSQYHHPVQ